MDLRECWLMGLMAAATKAELACNTIATDLVAERLRLCELSTLDLPVAVSVGFIPLPPLLALGPPPATKLEH